MSEDPLGFDAGDDNVRRYVSNDSVRLVDPSGLDEEGGGGWINWIKSFIYLDKDSVDGRTSIGDIPDNFDRTRARKARKLSEQADPGYKPEEGQSAGETDGTSEGLDKAKPGIKLLVEASINHMAAAGGVVSIPPHRRIHILDGDTTGGGHGPGHRTHS